MNEERRSLLRLVRRPMQLVFWGSVLVLLDCRVGMRWRGPAIDLLPDWAGLWLVAIGVSLLALRGAFTGSVDTAATVSAALFVAIALGSVARWFFPDFSAMVTWAWPAVGLVIALAGSCFLAAVVQLLGRLELAAVTRWWSRLGLTAGVVFMSSQALALAGQSLAATLLGGGAILVVTIGMFVIVRAILVASREPSGYRGERSGTI